ncbi:putative thiazole-containing bacteriocin maturation protein [Paenibacillus aceris]|uniref:Thiazole-containing bacteriocin maturation protein n=1 Tax=Paenibacillus aceris TaxID=869555 RepID=A0ABS4HRE1_9BACL|nr:putative thiazole-containing bacteriocin maturation protein [Paenibacillus aceris]MBP1960846.1 putative thiazole-containing bacteriocin maturation protein [Paenibacillus aceris]NHW35478.1 putative thiazole-containing bacteriocin maturation protein [Paenibacillus aceris]
MANLNPSMRLKMKRDTFFLPDPNGSVYFRNNVSSFRLEGVGIDRWIEKLIPIFNGEHRLKDLTDGLPDQHRKQVYGIAEMLYRNGFVRDASQDTPHQLSEEILQKYASQIEFLDHFGDSGAYRFQSYRQSKVLTVGSGPFLISVISALLESGLPNLHVVVTGSEPTDRQRILELAEHARKTDPEVVIEEVTLQKEGNRKWREAVRLFDSILFVSQEGDIEALRVLHAVCREEKKVFLPAVCLKQVGMAGPLVHPDSESCWESAWRSIHESAICKDPELHTFSSTAGALLANVIVFELLKKITGVNDSEQSYPFYLLNLETLEGKWHSFVPHPLVTGRTAVERIHDFELQLERRSSKSESGLLPYFGRLTSAESGIFHVWEEGDLKQLPLSQCRVQAIDPLSEGPATLLSDIVCIDLTHEGARREAGLAGIETYVSRMAGLLVSTLSSHQEVEGSRIEPQEFIGIGAGETVAEGLGRGLLRCLAEEMGKQLACQLPSVSRVHLSAIEDKRCQFYFQALTTMKGEPMIGLGEAVSGFPVVWVGTDDRWYGGVGLNVTFALRDALQQALLKAQNQPASFTSQVLEVSSVHLAEQLPLSLEIPSCEATVEADVLQSALQVLKRNHKRLLVFDLAVEPFLKEEMAGVFGVLLRKEGSR